MFNDTSFAPIDAKTQRINISGDTVMQATQHLAEEQRSLIRWSFDFAKDNAWDWRESERNYKINSTTLYRVWNGKYVDPKTGALIGLGGVCDKLATFKRIAEQRGMNKLPFIETSVWRRIDHICSEVLISQSIGFIFGESQIGKTRSLEEHARRNNHGQTVLVTMPPAAGVQLMCREIAAALHIGDSSFDKTYGRICKALDGEKLLIIDEAHMIFETYQRGSIARCLATLRHIHDRSKCGLIISATEVFQNEAKRSEFKNTMKQFFRRGTLTLQLGTQPPWKDVLAIIAHYKLPVPVGSAEETLRTLAREDGLGKITKHLAGAARMAAKKDQPLSWTHFERYSDITDRMAKQVK